MRYVVHGWFWEIVHVKTGQRVNSGYSHEPMNEGEFPVPSLRGFVMRVKTLYERKE